jgi:hypothetical protein
MTWRRAAAVLPGVGVALLPKLTCPMCWPAYAGLLSTVGLSFLLASRYLFGVTALFLVLSVGALGFRARERHGYSPAFIGLAASALVLFGKFYMESPATMHGALGLLVAASVWNSWPVRPAAACPQCAPSGTVQLSSKEESYETQN